MSGLLARLSDATRRRWEPVPDLDVRMAAFREIFHANNQALGAIAAIQELLAGERSASASEVQRLVATITVQTYRMIVNLNRMTRNRYRALIPRFNDVKSTLAQKVEVTPFLGAVGPVMPLSEVGAAMAEVVGQKSAFLGEARRILRGHVPEGFVTTVNAYRDFLAVEELRRSIDDIMAGLKPGDVAACFHTAAQITQLIETTPVPPSLAESIEGAVATVAAGAAPRFAVRSSALQEGGLEMSFAGQYRSLLNVVPEQVVDAFRKVVASKYSPQAITYRLGRGFGDHEVAMCCCAITMVDAVAAGVLYSACRTAGGLATLIQAVRGLGLSAVDGSAEPDSYLLDPRLRRLVTVKLGRQTRLLRCARGEGTEREEIPETQARIPILSEAQALAVADLAWRLEAALGRPLDMEWAIDRQGRPWVLQVRPQPEHVEGVAQPTRSKVPGAKVLLEGGSRASGGAACGAVNRVETDLDILRCPPGVVLVTSEASPRLAVLLPKVVAIVADMGEVTGHLATVARELHLPALFATRTATGILGEGAVVTVDADAGVVYAGRVDEVLRAAAMDPPPSTRNPHAERLASVADLIVPLTLRDRLASGYTPRKCKTLHDMIRFCHQATVEAMFDLGDRTLRGGGAVRRLLTEVPIDCRIFDLGGGLRPGVAAGDVRIEDVLCVPMRALWRGLTDTRLRWRTTRPVSLRGFMSAVINYNFDQDSRMRSMGEPSYVFISADYLNLNSRVGYHFSTVDARISEAMESNYASFRFVGGATGVEQRSRRAVLIQRLLAANGFETDAKADLINARIRHRPAAQMEEALTLIGLVTGYANHLDMALTSDSLVRVYEEKFLAGEYGFKGDEHA